jgi:hypothetical protein
MTPLRYRNQAQWVSIVCGVLLALYYFLVYLPLDRRVRELDEPFQRNWDRLVEASLETSAIQGLDMEKIEAGVEDIRATLQALQSVSDHIRSQIEFEPEIRARIQEPFHLFDFQTERQFRIENLRRMAQDRKVKLTPGVLSSLPEYSAEQTQPSLLWAQLATAHHLLASAIRCEIGEIRSLGVPPIKSHPVQSGGRPVLEELPVRLEVVGSMEAVSRWLLCIPMSAEAIEAAGLPEALSRKPVLFVDQILLRKASPEDPGAVRMEIRVSGFAYRD